MADDTQEKLDVAIRECIRLEKENALLVQALRSIDGCAFLALAGARRRARAAALDEMEG